MKKANPHGKVLRERFFRRGHTLRKVSLCLFPTFLLNACHLNNMFSGLPPTGQVSIKVIWPENTKGFTTHQGSYYEKLSSEERQKLGITKMRVSVIDSNKEAHKQTLDFDAKKATFKNVAEGRVTVLLECTDDSGKVMFRGHDSDVIDTRRSTQLEIFAYSLDMNAIKNVANMEKTSNSSGMTFVKIPAGTFTMGSPESEEGRSPNETQFQVSLSEFYLQTTEVTVSQWTSVMGNIPSGSGAPGDTINPDNPDLPVRPRTMELVQDFIRELNLKGEGYYRLPTEAEWEYAARAGTTTPWACGEKETCLGGMAWYKDNADAKIYPVALLAPNAWGLYDMYGNLAEITSQINYANYAVDGYTTKDPRSDGSTILRGGWNHSSPVDLRSARRGLSAGSEEAIMGLRLVRS